MSSQEEKNSWKIDAYDINPFDEFIWETKDGQRIPVSQMRTSHIKNCIKMIYKSNGTWRRNFLRFFEEELRYRHWNKRLLKEKFIFRL